MQIQNQDATQIIRDSAKLTLTEGYPQNLLPNVQAVMDMSPRFHRLIDQSSGSGSTAGASLTIHTASSDKDSFIYGATLAFIKDATCDVASGRINLLCVVKGASKTILCLPLLTLTAQQSSISISLPIPIKIDRGSVVTIGSSTFTVGAMVKSANVQVSEVTN